MTLWLKRCLLFIGALCLLVGAGVTTTMFGRYPNVTGLLTLCGIFCLIGLSIWNHQTHKKTMAALELRRSQILQERMRKEGPK